MTGLRSVALGFWVGFGSRDEPASAAGASHFLEHLLFKGTRERSAKEIAEVIDAVGGEMNAFTSRDHTAFYLRVLEEDVEVALDVLCDIMWQPAFRVEDVEAERQVILEELLTRGDEPEDLVQELLTEALYPGHPLGREVLGDETTVASISADELCRFHDDSYRPGAMVMAAAGALEHEHIVAGVEQRFARSGRCSGGERPVRTPPHGMSRPVTVCRKRTEQAHLALALPGPDRHDPDRYAVTLLAQILGGGVSSRLFQEVRERRGLAYSIYAYRASYDDAGSVVVYAGSAPSRAPEVLDIVSHEIDRLVEGVTGRELDVAKGNVIGSTALGLEDSGARMSRLGRTLLLHGEVPAIDEVVHRFLDVTRDDVARVATLVAGAPRALAVVGPVRASDFRRRSVLSP